MAQTTLHFDPQSQQITCQGEWTLASLAELKAKIPKIAWPKGVKLTIDGSKLSQLDSSGAWLLNNLTTQLLTQKNTVELQGFSGQQKLLLSLIEKQQTEITTIPQPTHLNWLARVGKHSIDQFVEIRNFLSFVGELAIETLRLLRHPNRIRWQMIASIIETTGYQALPIIALLSFMIGVVMTYQMGAQLRSYGANIYIVDLLGLAILREFAPLITSIMVAGRTGSSFTAQLGTMKLNEEIDALQTMGVTPAEILLIPRIIGLLIALPLLTMWANIFSIFGGMVMAKTMLNISWYDFLHRFQTQIPLKSLIIGLGKTPIFALLIASIGCFQGIQTRLSADSVGKQTTKSVVLAIFFIIVADAFFSIIFSKLGV